MAEDRKDQPAGTQPADAQGAGSAIPNRDRRREPPTIDARPGDVKVIVTPVDQGKPTQASPATAGSPPGASATPAPSVSNPSGAGKDASGPANSPSPASVTAGTAPARADAAKPVTPSPDMSKPDGAKPEAGKSPAGSLPGAKSDSTKPEPAKSEPSKETAGKPASSTTPPKTADAASSPPARRSAGIGALLLSSVAGAAIALGGGYALLSTQYYSAREVDGKLADGAAKSVAGISSTISDGQKKLEDQAGKLNSAVDAVSKRVAALEAQTKKMSGDFDAMVKSAQSLQPVSSQPPAASASPADAAQTARWGELETRIAALEKALAGPKTEVRASDPDVQPPAPAATATSSVAPAVVAQVAEIAQRLKAMESRPEAKPADLAPLQSRLQELEKQLAPLAAKIAPLEQKITPLEQKFAPLEAALAQNQASLRDALGGQTKAVEAGREKADAAALAVITRSLADALASGAPFANLLKAAQALGADSDAAKVLEKNAIKGIPPAAALAAQFAPLGTAIAESENKPSPNASLTEKLAASASRLVRIRPADDTTEETTPALIARIGAALRAGRFEEAQALFQKIPEAQRAPANTWAASIRERIEADRAISTISNAALARLSR